jgi:diguanylate cyclase (GGDEF)-like protein
MSSLDNSRYLDRTEAAKILCVDDEESVVNSLRRVLRSSHYEVIGFTSAPEALKYLESNEVDLIVSDMRMPEMRGDEFLAKTMSITPNTVRILLTGYSDFDMTVSAINEGRIHRYMSKPWDNSELLAIINEELVQKQRDDEKRNYDELVKSLTATDPLTGLLNRTALMEQVEAQAIVGTALPGVAPSYLILLDVDNFSSIVESVGPQTSEDVLKLVGRLLSFNLRSGDIIARTEDDEFGIMLNQYAPEDCITGIMERVRMKLASRTYLVRNQKVDIQITLAAKAIDIGDDPEELYNAAKKALKFAKSEGKNRSEIAD